MDSIRDQRFYPHVNRCGTREIHHLFNGQGLQGSRVRSKAPGKSLPLVKRMRLQLVDGLYAAGEHTVTQRVRISRIAMAVAQRNDRVERVLSDEVLPPGAVKKRR
jgi:hypothetical protein